MNVQHMVTQTEDCLRDMIDAGLVTRVAFYGSESGTKPVEWKVVPWLSQKKPDAYKTMVEIQMRTREFGFKVEPAVEQD
jgi:hypothetical protein